MSTATTHGAKALTWHALPLRLVGAALLAATAAIHLHLWSQGYRDIHLIGPLFLLDSVSAIGLALAVLLSPSRLLPWAALLGGLLELGTLGGLVMSATVGVFGFTESWQADLVPQSIVVESVGGALMLGYAAARARRTAARR